jgi:hypothetical protein
MDGVKLISLEFAMGIVADKQKIKVDWAAIAEETNRTQRSKFTKRLNRIVADATRDGATHPISRIKEEKLGDGRPYKTKKDADLGSTAGFSELAELSGAASCLSQRSAEWMIQLGVEVNQLLQLCSMELEASKQQLEKLRKEKEDLADKVRSVFMLLEHVQTSLEEQVRKTQVLEDSEKCAAVGVGGPPSPATPTKIEMHNVPSRLVEHRIQERMWRSMVSKHELQYKGLYEQAEAKETSFKELQQMGQFLERQYSALSEHLISLKKRKRGFSMYPHPLCYPSEQGCLCVRPFVSSVRPSVTSDKVHVRPIRVNVLLTLDRVNPDLPCPRWLPHRCHVGWSRLLQAYTAG